jgi:ribosomal protein L40E
MQQNADASAEPDKRVICLGCSRVVPPEADFCPRCGTPLSSTSTTDPYKSVFAEGQMYWRLTHGPLPRIVVIGFGLMFCTGLAIAASMLWHQLSDTSVNSSERYVGALLPAASLVLSVGFGVAVGRNYLRQKQSSRQK